MQPGSEILSEAKVINAFKATRALLTKQENQIQYSDVTITISEIDTQQGGALLFKALQNKVKEKTGGFFNIAANLLKLNAVPQPIEILNTVLAIETYMCQDFLEYSLIDGTYQYTTEFKVSIELYKEGQFDMYMSSVREFNQIVTLLSKIHCLSL